MIVTDNRREQILDKAALRFAHFGIHKTTMNEIAVDLSISKPSVYYYFPDKTSLVIAVIERILGEYIDRLESVLSNAKALQEAINTMLELRREFIQKYFMLHLTDQTEVQSLTKDIRKSILETRKREVKLIQRVFESAKAKEGLQISDTERTAALFIDMLAGIGICVMARQEKQLVPDNTVFEEVLKNQMEIAGIFIKGLN